MNTQYREFIEPFPIKWCMLFTSQWCIEAFLQSNWSSYSGIGRQLLPRGSLLKAFVKNYKKWKNSSIWVSKQHRSSLYRVFVASCNIKNRNISASRNTTDFFTMVLESTWNPIFVIEISANWADYFRYGNGLIDIGCFWKQYKLKKEGNDLFS